LHSPAKVRVWYTPIHLPPVPVSPAVGGHIILLTLRFFWHQLLASVAIT